MEAQVVHVDPQDAEKNKVMGILAYIGLLFLVPLFAAKESKFAMYHANQGLILCIASFGLSIILSITVVLAILTPLVFIATIIFAILGIINVTKGECKPLPLIGKFQILKY